MTSTTKWLRLLIISVLIATTFCSGATSQARTETTQLQAPTTAPWLDSQTHAGIVYFLFGDTPRIERYHLANQVWLNSIALPVTPTAFTVDNDGLYVSFARRTSRFTLNGTNEVHLGNTTADVHALFVINNVVYLHYINYPNGHITSLNKTTGAIIDSKDYLYQMLVGISIARSHGKMFGRDTGLSPAEIVQIVLNTDGTLGAGTDSPYHGDFPAASRTWMFPNEARVADNSGTVYSTSDLRYTNSFGGSFDDLAFYGDVPIVLRGNMLFSYSTGILETGRKTLATSQAAIEVYQTTVFAFSASGSRGVVATLVPVSDLTPQLPGTPVDPRYLVFTPDAVLMHNNVVYLLSRSHLSVFRWSITNREYLPTIPLANTPLYMAHSAENNRLYLGYQEGAISQVNLAGPLTEQPFATSPAGLCGLATAGSIVFACDNSGAWRSHVTFNAAGTQVSYKDWNYFSDEYIWSAANRKMYFFRDDTSPNDLLWEDIDVAGTLGAQGETPYHDSNGIDHPIRVSPDGSIVLLGSGRIYNAISLALVNSLSNTINDATWNTSLFTIRATQTGTQLQKWNSTYGIVGQANTAGSPVRTFNTPNGLVVISSVFGMPRFTLWDTALQPVYASPTINQLLAGNTGPTVPNQTVTLSATVKQSVGPLSYSWAFGDGSTATTNSSTIAHSYAQAGTYTAVVSATNGVNTLTASTNVVVRYQPITTVSITSNSPRPLGDVIQLTAQANGTVLNYAWNLGDGTTASGASVSHVYQQTGTYTVSVTASNPTSQATASTIVVVNQPPSLVVNPLQLNFVALEGETTLAQTVSINSSTTDQATWIATPSAAWIVLDQLRGTTPGVLSIRPNSSVLAVGPYSGTISLRTPNSVIPKAIIQVSLHVSPTIITTPITLTAASGISDVVLNWNPLAYSSIKQYRVMRRIAGTAVFTALGTTNQSSYTDQTAINGTQYCYRIDALRADQSVGMASNETCTLAGQLELWVPDVRAGEDRIAFIPVNIRNANNLRIAASDIWLDLDPTVLEPLAVLSTPFSAQYQWSYGVEQVGNRTRVRIATVAPNAPQLAGAGSLFWLKVRVLGANGSISPLDLRDFVANIGGSTLYTPDDVNTSVPLLLQDGTFTVADTTTLGDLNGNGVVEAVDAYIVLRSITGHISLTAAQRMAADVNGNGEPDTGDATLILYYATHGEWIPQAQQRRQAPAETVALRLDQVSGVAGETVTVKLRTDQLQDFAGGSFLLHYNPADITRIDVSAADMAAGFQMDAHETRPGALRIALANASGVSGAGSILTLHITLAATTTATTSNLLFKEADINDSHGRDFNTSALGYTISREDGAITIQPSVQTYTVFLPLIQR